MIIQTNYRIKYSKNDEKLKAYTDSDWAGDVNDRKSCTGTILILAGELFVGSPRSKHQQSLSIIEAEYVTLSKIEKCYT